METKHATIIECVTPEIIYFNLVFHECLCGEFAQDIKRETKEYLEKKGKLTQIDIFWHLDEYCEKHYGQCHWQTINIDSLVNVQSGQ